MLVLDDFGVDLEATGALDSEEADRAFLEAVRAKNRSAWVIGDLVNSGSLSDQVFDGCTLSQKTMNNYSLVCERYPKRLRRIPLSQSHYEGAAKLAGVRMDEALALLREAYDSGLDRNWVRVEAAKLLGEYVETVEFLVVFDATRGVFAASGLPAWLPDGFTRTLTARRE